MAQQQNNRGGYAGFVAAGVSGIATGELDSRLAASGYPTFGSRPRGLALGAYRLLRSGVMLGAEWHGLKLSEADHEGRGVGLGGGYATLAAGYAVEISPRVRVYPRLGLGAGGLGLWIEKADEEETSAGDFDEALRAPNADPERSVLSQTSMVVDYGAGAELLLDNRRGGPIVGLRLGLITTPFNMGWTRDGRSLNGAPEASVAGPYARLAIGWRWR